MTGWNHLIYCNAGSRTPLGGEMCICLKELSSVVESLTNYQTIKALDNLLNRYVGLVNSGDAGNWDPEQEQEVRDARAVLKTYKTDVK
jgi:hypothetical protein